MEGALGVGRERAEAASPGEKRLSEQKGEWGLESSVPKKGSPPVRGHWWTSREAFQQLNLRQESKGIRRLLSPSSPKGGHAGLETEHSLGVSRHQPQRALANCSSMHESPAALTWSLGKRRMPLKEVCMGVQSHI